MRRRAELAAEQAHVDRAYALLDRLRHRAREVSSELIGVGKGITRQAALEREAAAVVTARRLQALKLGDHTSLCFGRIDVDTGEAFHVGRFGVSDDDGDPLVVDWRAPVAEAFYRATPLRPLGVVRRRHFLTRGRLITGLDDEVFDAHHLDRAGDTTGKEALVLSGEASLLAALTRSRTGRMSDIVASIQAQQDEAIRAPLTGTLVVQGGPGTGKTAVALHRAAYLLYTHRFPLESAGVLFVGPNPTFLHYVEQVLPALGESTVALATPGTLFDGVVPVGRESGAVERIKGDGRMADVLRRAVRARQRALREAVTIPVGRHNLVLTADHSARIVRRARNARGRHNERRALVERLVVNELIRQAEEAQKRDVRVGMRGPAETEEVVPTRADFRRHRQVRVALDRMWPVLTPQRLLNDLFGSSALLASAAREVLGDEELRLLERPGAADPECAEWTASDVALLDEATELLGGPPAPRRRRRPPSKGEDDAFQSIIDRTMADAEGAPRCPDCESELEFIADRDQASRPWRCPHPDCGRMWPSRAVLTPEAEVRFHELRQTLGAHREPEPELPALRTTYGHVVIDEAQDLSPMQWRMLARRCPSGSFTIVGDLGQASGAWSPSSWEATLTGVAASERLRVLELTVNYRTPIEVARVAESVLRAARPDLVAPRAVRASGHPVNTRRSSPNDLLAAVGEVVRAECLAVEGGKVAVITPDDLLATARSSLDAGHDLDADLVVLSTDECKGLEFDSVVLVEPGALAADGTSGLRAVYVALTRTTQRLTIVHSLDLPPALSAGLPAVAVGRRP